jgi:Putative Flp pilus-assembly TadE/G-like
MSRRIPSGHLGATGPQGQVLVVGLLTMIVLLLMLGLAIDGGRGYWERRQAQNAAEHAALAGAWELCHNTAEHDGWEDAARDAAADNGFVHDGVNVWVAPANSSGLVSVTVRSRLATTFATLLGFGSLDAEGHAVADCRNTSGEGFALFAGGDNCESLGKYQIEFSGGHNAIQGAVHSNGNVRYNGSNNSMTGTVTYADPPLIDSGNDNVFTPPHDDAPSQDWPVRFQLSTYFMLATQDPHDDMHYFTEVVDWADITANGDGLYYSTEKIDISGSGPVTLDLTLVSEKEVIISGSDIDIRPFVDNLLAFSGIDQPMNDRCDKEGVKMSGGENEWRGFIYADKSAIIMDGSSNSTLIGSLIGWAIKVSGSTLNNTADPAFFAGPPVLRLVE